MPNMLSTIADKPGIILSRRVVFLEQSFQLPLDSSQPLSRVYLLVLKNITRRGVVCSSGDVIELTRCRNLVKAFWLHLPYIPSCVDSMLDMLVMFTRKKGFYMDCLGRFQFWIYYFNILYCISNIYCRVNIHMELIFDVAAMPHLRCWCTKTVANTLNFVSSLPYKWFHKSHIFVDCSSWNRIQWRTSSFKQCSALTSSCFSVCDHRDHTSRGGLLGENLWCCGQNIAYNGVWHVKTWFSLDILR